ncbi:MAG: DUF2975 domain-containing protein [Acutalibacteraceae bacterium]
MLSQTKSAKLSLYLTDFIIALFCAAAVFLPRFTKWYITYMGRPANVRNVILAVCYTCLPFALLALFSLRRLLKNIMQGDTFVTDNIKRLNILFLCCVAAAVISFFSGYFYLPFYIISVAAAFFSLILRVIKNVFRSAIEIKAENELTI